MHLSRRSGPLAGLLTSFPLTMLVAALAALAAGPAAASAYSDAVLADNPIHYWRLEETSTAQPALDEGTAGGNNGVYAGGILLSQPSASANMGSAADFDGAPGTLVDLGTLHAGDSISVEAWVHFRSGSSFSIAVSRWDLSWEMGLNLNAPARRPYFIAKTDPGAVFRNATSGAPIPVGEWHHLAGVLDSAGGTIRLYVDGGLVASDTFPSGHVLHDGALPAPDTKIGASRNGVSSSFNWDGLIDEVAIYDYPLTQAQIQAHIDAALTPDADCDGVPDPDDLCPGTALGDPVDASGCSDAQVDADGDGFCVAGAPSGGPSGCAGEDCDDGDPDVFPGNPEVCDGKDNDCANGVDDGLFGGSAECLDLTQVTCYNRSTRRRKSFVPAGTTWDCEAEGLVVSTGQRLVQYIYGTAQASCSPVDGAVCGANPTYLQCLNLDNGTRGYPPVATSWDCEAAGMIVTDGQRVRMTVDGTVD